MHLRLIATCHVLAMLKNSVELGGGLTSSGMVNHLRLRQLFQQPSVNGLRWDAIREWFQLLIQMCVQETASSEKA